MSPLYGIQKNPNLVESFLFFWISHLSKETVKGTLGPWGRTIKTGQRTMSFPTFSRTSTYSIVYQKGTISGC